MSFIPTCAVSAVLFTVQIFANQKYIISNELLSRLSTKKNALTTEQSGTRMEFSYVVLLKPSEIRFTTNFVKERFDNNIPLTETLTQLRNGEVSVDDIPPIEVIWYQEKWEWYTMNNRRLWVFQQLEKSGHCQFIKTRRIEKVENIFDYPAILYGSASLEIKAESPSRKVNVLATWNSTEGNPRGKGKKGRFEYREMRVSIEQKYSTHHTSSRYETYHETCTISEYQSRHEHRRSGKSRRHRGRSRHHPYKQSTGSSLAKLQPSRRYLTRARELQKFSESRSSSRVCGPVCGIVSYGFWRKRRLEFLQKVYSLRTGRLRDPGNLANVMFTCGVCYKSFKTRVSLEQHSEELLHFACVRCGKFFTSNTALGQHRISLTHYVY